MATGDRTKKIVSQVQFVLGGLNGGIQNILDNVPRQLILDRMQQAQYHFAQDFLLLEERNASFTVTTGTASEPSGFFRAKHIALTSTLLIPLKEVSIEEYDWLSKNSTNSLYQTPTVFARWNGTMYFYPEPTSGTYTLYYYGVPTTSITDAIDPEISTDWDDAIGYQAIIDIAPMIGRADLLQFYTARLEQEKQLRFRAWKRTKTQVLSILPENW